MSVLVYTEHAEGKFKKSSFEVVSYGGAVAQQLGTNLVALSIGNVSSEELNKLAHILLNALHQVKYLVNLN